ncbi:epm2a-interacting protein 1 [Holotrichia oblita]|uniref:Epm2a-interacting protein 1 n=1 Tax=Holotrichia oblita TaxID=644536 RepID=A0ACB9TV56_HOLOL|nr:epm2a-interacting protein 1 [Holotrichia oblita]
MFLSFGYNFVNIGVPIWNRLTDEDSGDEDDGGLVDNLSRRQLCANAEIVFPNQTRIGGLAEDNNGEVGAVEFMPQPSTSTASVSSAAVNISTRPKNLVFCETGDLTPSLYGFLPGDYSRFATLSCVELFELFFTNNLLETIAAHTKSYALFKNCPDPNELAEKPELCIFSDSSSSSDSDSDWYKLEDTTQKRTRILNYVDTTVPKYSFAEFRQRFRVSTEIVEMLTGKYR